MAPVGGICQAGAVDVSKAHQLRDPENNRSNRSSAARNSPSSPLANTGEPTATVGGS